MATFNVHQAKSQLSKLLDQAQAGEEVVIAKAGVPVAKLVPIKPRPDRSALFGLYRGKIVLESDWDSEVVNAEIARAFDEGDVFPGSTRRGSRDRSRRRKPV